jgi:taurine dioxygenase
MKIKVVKLAHALGAEVTGVDLARRLDEQTVREIRAAWLEHLVVVVRNQTITPEQHIAFSRRFGELEVHHNRYNRHEDFPELYVVTNKTIDGRVSDTRNVGRQWHSDGAYKLQPSMGSLLYSKEIPPVGGDTLFTNMYMAFETLSPTLQRVLESLCAINDRGAAKNNQYVDPQRVAERLKLAPPVVNPVVRVHPETERKALYVSPNVTTAFEGMTREESRPLLEYLFAHSVKQEFIFRHRWQVHDLLMWDNRCTMHLAPPDYDTSLPRYMVRTTIAGTPLGRLYEAQS